FREAELLALKAHDLDPENLATDAAMQMVRFRKNVERAHSGKQAKEDLFVDGLDDNPGPVVNMDDPLMYNKDVTERNKHRKDFSTGIRSESHDPAVKAIERRLEQPITLNFKDTPLQQVIDDLHDL